MSFNPYAPPVAESPVPSHGHHSSPLAGEGALALWVGDTLPDVCLKCGALDGLERRRLPLSRRPFWVYGFLFVGLITFFVVDSGMPKGWLSGCLCRHCLGRYSAAQWARWSIALPLVAWFFTLIMASSIGGEDALGEVLVLTLFLQVAVLFTVFAWLVQKFFVAPRILDLLGLTGLGAHGIGMRVAGIHPQAASAYFAARSWSAPWARPVHEGYTPHASPPLAPAATPVANGPPVAAAADPSSTLVSPAPTEREPERPPEPEPAAPPTISDGGAASTLLSAVPSERS